MIVERGLVFYSDVLVSLQWNVASPGTYVFPDVPTFSILFNSLHLSILKQIKDSYNISFIVKGSLDVCCSYG